MKHIYKLLVLIALVMAMAICSYAAEAEIPDESIHNLNTATDEEISILCVGNSILAHGVAESIGWTGNWGMAASAPENDYYHLLQKKTKEAGYNNVIWSRVAVSSLERQIDKRLDYDYAAEINSGLANAVKSAMPDVVIFQIGENVNQSPTRAYYKNAMIKLAEYCQSINPDVDIIFCKPFWAGDSKCSGVKDAAVELGFTFADLAKLNSNQYKAIGLFEHSGVAAHPGDLGMKTIAELIFEQLSIILNKKYVDNDAVAVQIDGQYRTFDVPAVLVDGIPMVPVRAICEACDAEVAWNDADRSVSVVAPGSRVSFVIGEKVFTKNKKEIEFSSPSVIVDSRTLIPANAIADILGYDVRFDSAKRVVVIEVLEEKPVVITQIVGDTCETLEKSGFYGGFSDLTVTNDDGNSNKYIKVECNKNAKVWTYIWAKMDFKPGKIYVVEVEAKLLDKDGAGNTIDKSAIGLCLRYDGKDHGIKITDVKVSDGWVRLYAEHKIPDGIEPNYDDDRFGVYVNPVNGIGASFAVDNITVKPKS